MQCTKQRSVPSKGAEGDWLARWLGSRTTAVRMHESWSLPFLDLLKAGRGRGFLLNTNKPNCYTTLHSGSVSDATKPDNPNANPLDLLLLEFTAVFNEKARVMN